MLLSTKASEFVLSGIKGNGVKVETGYFNGEEWVKTTDKDYTESNSDITIETADYDCIRIETADMPIELKNLSVDSDGSCTEILNIIAVIFPKKSCLLRQNITRTEVLMTYQRLML